jgi:hypothetical protein
MSKETINLMDNYNPMLKDKVVCGADQTPRGVVSVYDKQKNGDLKLLERSNMIVFQGREWLLQRAFGPSLQGNTNAADKYIKWFGVGTGGGEPGNPLQAGETHPWDTDMTEPLVINPDGDLPDYAPRLIATVEEDGYFKGFSSVVRKEDPANSYLSDGTTLYPSLIAEIRIELSSADGNGTDESGYADLNEAALYIDNPDVSEPAEAEISTASLNIHSVELVSEFGVKYIFETGTDISLVTTGDKLTVTGATNAGNDISSKVITQVCTESGGCLAYAIVENSAGVDEVFDSPATAIIDMKATLDDISIFSRVTFSSLRKTSDREIVFIWRIYF